MQDTPPSRDDPEPGDDDDAALTAWARCPQPGGDFTEAQVMRSLLAWVPPHEQAEVLRQLAELTAPPAGENVGSA